MIYNICMKIYLVGGAVRDLLLKKAPEDRDYVIVEASKEDVKHLEDTLFFKVDEKTGDREVTKVGKSFPVYLHPETGEEYALARKERKVDEGYHGFEFEFDENVSLEDDLKRRDLTINSIAMDLTTNQIIDPFDGRKDLKNKVLRPTSEAFKEDPLRCLRAARFAAQLGFKVSKELSSVMKDIANSGELESLSYNRLSKEYLKAQKTGRADVFFNVLRENNCLKDTFSFVYNFDDELYESFLKTIVSKNLNSEQVLHNVFYFFSEDSKKLFNLGKSEEKLFKVFKNNCKRLLNNLDNAEEILDLIKLFGFGRRNNLENFLKESLLVLFGKKDSSVDFLSRISIELSDLNLSEVLDKVSSGAKAEKVKEIKLKKIEELLKSS